MQYINCKYIQSYIFATFVSNAIGALILCENGKKKMPFSRFFLPFKANTKENIDIEKKNLMLNDNRIDPGSKRFFEYIQNKKK